MIEWKETERGFTIGKFKDVYGEECSIQDSSSVEPRIWLGISDAKPQLMKSDARRLGLPITPDSDGENGWTPYEIPKEVLLSTRMHLGIEEAKALIEELQIFVDTTYLRKP